MKRGGGEEELDGKYFGHTDSDKKLVLHIAGFQANPGEKKKKRCRGLQLKTLVVGFFSWLSSSHHG